MFLDLIIPTTSSTVTVISNGPGRELYALIGVAAAVAILLLIRRGKKGTNK